MTDQDFHLTFWEHVEELRKTLIKVLVIIGLGTCASLFFYPQIFSFATQMSDEMQKSGHPLVLLSPTEGITTIFKMSFWVGLLGTSPLWLFVVLRFAAPALRLKERRLILPFIALSFILLGVGSIFGLRVTQPLANAYLSEVNKTLGENFWSLSHYLNYTLFLVLANALAFEAFAVLFFLVHYGKISAEGMRSKRKGVIVSIFIASAVLTPPDVLTQLMLAAPLCLGYEAALLYAALRKRQQENK